MTVLRFSDSPAMPWANGGGVTHELLVQPPAASVDEFDWRISVADVDGASEFSRFPEIDRVLLLLERHALTLTVNGTAMEAAFGIPVRFQGEDRVTTTSSPHAVRVLNVMTRRRRFSATVEVHRSPESITADPHETVVLIGVTGRCRVLGSPASTLTPGDAVVLSGPVSMDGDGKLATIRLRGVEPSELR